LLFHSTQEKRIPTATPRRSTAAKSATTSASTNKKKSTAKTSPVKAAPAKAKKPPAASAKKPATASTKKPAAKKATPLSFTEKVTQSIVRALDDKKAEDISVINVLGKCSFADVMVIATGRSARHVATLADDAVDAIRTLGISHPMVEGKEVGDWVLIDAGDVVIHLFRPEVRLFYNLEKMWSAPAAAPTELRY
jgi:ribosome-associated protein